MVGAKPSDIIFTSGGTEGNNMILHSALKYFHHRQGVSSVQEMFKGDNSELPHFITSNLEHDSVKLVLENMAEEGIASVTFVPASSKTGYVEKEDVLAAIRPSTCMVSIMLANNETGVIQPIKDIFESVSQVNTTRRLFPKILLHTDVAQALGKIEVNVQDLKADYLTIVGHKFYGPRIGAVYVRDLGSKPVPLFPMLYGGGQERNYRPGTENTGMIAGLGKASQLVVKNLSSYQQHIESVRDYLEEKLRDHFGERLCINGKFCVSERLPNTCNISIIGDKLQGHNVLGRCKKIQASVGAACHSQNKASPILQAIGIPFNVAQNAIRLSVGRETTLGDIDVCVEDLAQAVESLEEQKITDQSMENGN